MTRLLVPTVLAISLLPAAAEQLSEAQLAAAQQVYLGTASCDAKQDVHLSAIAGKPGHFELRHKKARYTLTPEPTSTGAIRLEDRQAGMVWLQIPAKSMLLNAKQGRREVDGCMHAEQRAENATAGASAIGIAAR